MAARSCRAISRGPAGHGCKDMFEAVGKHSVGEMSDLRTWTKSSGWRAPRPAPGGAQFTANTMATVSEAIGLALPYSAGAPRALRDFAISFCMTAGEKVMELIATNIRPRDNRPPEKALENAAAVVCRLRRLDQCCTASAGDRQ